MKRSKWCIVVLPPRARQGEGSRVVGTFASRAKADEWLCDEAQRDLRWNHVCRTTLLEQP